MSLYLKPCNARDLDFFFFLFLSFSPIISNLISLNLITIQSLHLIFLLLNKLYYNHNKKKNSNVIRKTKDRSTNKNKKIEVFVHTDLPKKFLDKVKKKL